jgi:hypothetical protein
VQLKDLALNRRGVLAIDHEAPLEAQMSEARIVAGADQELDVTLDAHDLCGVDLGDRLGLRDGTGHWKHLEPELRGFREMPRPKALCHLLEDCGDDLAQDPSVLFDLAQGAAGRGFMRLGEAVSQDG